MQVLAFIAANGPEIFARSVEHLWMVSLAILLAVLVGIPLGIAITRSPAAADAVLYVCGIIMTIPSVAMFGVMIPVFSTFGQGIGPVPAVAAVTLYSLLPIVRNTYTGIASVDPALREAAAGMGMTWRERLLRVELPIAVPVILAGVRLAAVLDIAIIAIAAYIGAGGLGTYISRGIAQTDTRQLVTGAVFVALLAVAVDALLGAAQRALTPRGLRAEGGAAA
jgi:osmoprotectant transport system permease protein